MARAHCREVVTSDKIGALAPIPFATVNVYETGTTTPIAQTIYSSATGVGTLTNPLTADANGLIEFWLPEAQVADLLISASGYTSQTVTTNVAGPTGTASNLNTSQALSVAGDVIVNASAPFLQFKDDAGTPATHSVPVLDAVQTFTAEQAITVSGSGTANLVLGNSTDSTGRIAGNTGCSLVMVPATGTSFNVWSNGKNGQALTVDDASGLTTLNYGLKAASGGFAVNGNISGNQAITIAGTQASSSGFAAGLVASNTFDTNTINTAWGVFVKPTTAAGAYTLSNLYKLAAGAATKGAGSTITTCVGVYVESMTEGSTNNYGVYINAPSGGSGANVGLRNAGTTLNIGAGNTAGGYGYSVLNYNQLAMNTGGSSSAALVGDVNGTTVNSTTSVVAGVIGRAFVTVNSSQTLSRLASLYGATNTSTINGTLTEYDALYLETPSGATVNRVINTAAGFQVRTDGSIGTAAGTFLHSSVALTNGAAAATGTLTNAPAAGNPTKWIPIDDNGTTRYIPAW